MSQDVHYAPNWVEHEGGGGGGGGGEGVKTQVVSKLYPLLQVKH